MAAPTGAVIGKGTGSSSAKSRYMFPLSLTSFNVPLTGILFGSLNRTSSNLFLGFLLTTPLLFGFPLFHKDSHDQVEVKVSPVILVLSTYTPMTSVSPFG